MFKTWIGWKHENVYCVAKQQNCNDKKETSKKGPFLVLWEPLLGTYCIFAVWILFSVSSINCDNSFGDLTAVCNTKKLSNNGM